MESLTRLVTESLARHGFDRPLDYRRLRWSRWFRCESHHSLLLVPSKPGVFALAEEISANSDLAAEESLPGENAPRSRRMLAVTQFFEDDDMAFVLDRMLARQNPMRDRLASGRYFIRFVVIEEESQRRSVCNALNHWVASQALGEQAVAYAPERAGSIGAHFASSLELTPATEYAPVAAQAGLFENPRGERMPSPAISATDKSGSSADETNAKPALIAATPLDSGAATNIHCPSPLPSGF